MESDAQFLSKLAARERLLPEIIRDEPVDNVNNGESIHPSTRYFVYEKYLKYHQD
jgi:hypothetical protein